jgi:hypothetical protein
MIRQSRRERLEQRIAELEALALKQELVIDVQTSLYCAFGFDLMRKFPEQADEMIKLLEEVENELEKAGAKGKRAAQRTDSASEDQLRSAL